MTIDIPLVPVNGRAPSATATTVAEPATSATVAALQRAILGHHGELHRRVREIVRGIGDHPLSNTTFTEEARRAPAFLRKFLTESGRPAQEIARDPQLRGALCDAAQVLAPRLLLVLTGHLDLAIGAILGLGNNSDYQQDCLAELDTGEALGVLMLTELGGTNGADQQTTAVWNQDMGCFVLSSPSMPAVKFMPNVADPSVPKTVVVTARLIVDGRDEGVLPFLLKLRTRPRPSWPRRLLQRGLPFLDLRPEPVLADGVHISTLPDKNSAPMDHAMIRFDGVLLPRDALLGGSWARLDSDGTFHCDVPLRARFHKAIAVLGEGRLDLANAAAASARAGLAGLVNYAAQRRSASGVAMSDRDAVQRDIVDSLATVYATSVFGRQLRDMRATADDKNDRSPAVLAMLAKPLLSNAAQEALTMVRERTAAQGALRVNHIVDWLGNLAAIITAEGENQIMQVTAGKRGQQLLALKLDGAPTELPWYLQMLSERVTTVADCQQRGVSHPASLAPGPDSVAIELSEATGHLLAATAVHIEARAADDPKARELLEAVCTAYALQTVYAHSAWYLDHEKYPRVVPELRRSREIMIENLSVLAEGFDSPTLDAPIFGPYLQWWERFSRWVLR
jgi:acyl-CoA oxidase